MPNPGGLVVAIVGVWLGCQILGGHMLERLGLVSGSGATGAAPAVAVAPAGGSPVPGLVWT